MVIVLQKMKNKSFWLILICWLVYSCSYIGKLGYSATIGEIESFYGVLHATAGTVSTFFFFAYGVGQVLNGVLCKWYNIKYVVFITLCVSAACNFIVALKPAFFILKYVWLINGFVLATLWPTLIRLLSESLSEKEQGKAVVVMGTTVATGTLLVYGLSACFAYFNAFNLIFYVAGLLLPCIALIWLFSYSKISVSLHNEKGEKIIREEKTSGMPHALWLPIVLLAVFAVVTNLTKDGLTTWVPVILKEKFAMDGYVSIALTVILPIFAIFGTAVAVLLNKKIKNMVVLCAVLFAMATALVGVVIGFISLSAAVTIASFACISCVMSSVNNVITSMAPLYWREKINSGLLAGVLNGFCYIGSAISSYGLGFVADQGGWDAVFYLLLFGCGLCVIVGAVYGGVTLLTKQKKSV